MFLNLNIMIDIVRWVNSSLEPHEKFLGIYKVDSTNAESLVKTIKDLLLLTDL